MTNHQQIQAGGMTPYGRRTIAWILGSSPSMTIGDRTTNGTYPSFSLGLDSRVHTIPAPPHGCPDQVRAKRGEGLDLAQSQIPRRHCEWPSRAAIQSGMHITRRPSSPSPLWGGIKGGGWPKGPNKDSAISPPTPRLWLHPTRPGCAGPPSPSRGGKTTSNHKTYRRPPNPVYPHPTFSQHRRRRDERPGWKGTGFLGGRLREGQNCAATSLPPLAGVPGKPGGDGPQR